MSIESLVALVQLPQEPPLFFFAGLFASVLICMSAVALETAIRRRAIESITIASKPFNYQKFYSELVTSPPRHVGFTLDEVHELHDHEFHPE